MSGFHVNCPSEDGNLWVAIMIKVATVGSLRHLKSGIACEALNFDLSILDDKKG